MNSVGGAEGFSVITTGSYGGVEDGANVDLLSVIDVSSVALGTSKEAVGASTLSTVRDSEGLRLSGDSSATGAGTSSETTEGGLIGEELPAGQT